MGWEQVREEVGNYPMARMHTPGLAATGHHQPIVVN